MAGMGKGMDGRRKAEEARRGACSIDGGFHERPEGGETGVWNGREQERGDGKRPHWRDFTRDMKRKARKRRESGGGAEEKRRTRHGSRLDERHENGGQWKRGEEERRSERRRAEQESRDARCTEEAPWGT